MQAKINLDHQSGTRHTHSYSRPSNLFFYRRAASAASSRWRSCPRKCGSVKGRGGWRWLTWCGSPRTPCGMCVVFVYGYVCRYVDRSCVSYNVHPIAYTIHKQPNQTARSSRPWSPPPSQPTTTTTSRTRAPTSRPWLSASFCPPRPLRR